MHFYRYVVLIHAVGAILLGMSIRAGLVSAVAQFGLVDTQIAGLVNATTIAAVAGAGLELAFALRSVPLLTFTDEVLAEVSRVTWPTRDEAVRAATTVVMTVALMATVISLYDLLWKQLADLILFNQS